MKKYTDDQLAAWLQDSPAAGPADALERALGVTRHTSQRPGWLVALTGGTIGTHEASGGTGRAGDRRAVTLLVAVLLVGLLAGGIMLGSGVVQLPSLLPSPSPEAEASPDATPGISAEPTPSPSPVAPLGLVAYNVTELVDPPPATCTPGVFHPWCSDVRIWVSNADGTAAHELLPDVPGDQFVIAWSPDGSRLLYSDELGALSLTDLNGSEPERFPYESLCPVALCPNLDGFAFSPDGTRLAYAALTGGESSVIAILDLATRQISLLESTRTNGQGLCQTDGGEGVDEFPRWSPDGTQLVFARQGIAPLRDGGCQETLYVVNADGSDLRQIAPSEMNALLPSWSPDGGTIVFRSVTFLPAYAQGDAEALTTDIHTVRPDGTNLRDLTSDGNSGWPGWTRDGRIVFLKWTDPQHETYALWIMDADGSNPSRLEDTSISALTALGCVTCTDGDGRGLLWQPIP